MNNKFTKVINVALRKTKDNEPVLHIVGGDAADKVIDDVIGLTTGLGWYNAEQFLKSLNTGLEIKWTKFAELFELLNKINLRLKEA